MDAELLARRMVALTLGMKRTYQDAGFMIARDFANQVGLDDSFVDDTEQEFRRDGRPLKNPWQVAAFDLIDRRPNGS